MPSYRKKDGTGACLIPGHHNIKKYIRDMDKRNRKIEKSKERKLSNDIQAITKEHFNKMFDIPVTGSNKKFRENYKEVFGHD